MVFFPDLANQKAQTQDIIDRAKAANPDIAAQIDAAAYDINDKWMTDYTVHMDPATGVTGISGKNTQGEWFIVPPVKAGDKATATDDINVAIQEVIKNAGGKNKLQAAFTKAGFSGDVFTNVANAIRAYGTNTLQTYQDAKGKVPFPTMGAFLGGLSKYSTGGSAGPKTTVNQAFTDRTGTDRDINKYFMENFGRVATVQEKLDYYNAVNAEEKKTKTTTTTVPDGTGGYKNVKSVGSQLTSADYALIAAGIAKKAFGSTTADALLGSKAPGKVASDINKVMSYADDYGIPMTTQQAMNYVSQGFGSANYLEGVQNRIKQLAIQMHPNLAPHIQAGGTVRDVADTYANAMTRKLGIVVPDSTKDKRVMSAVNNGVNLADWDRQMQAMPEWGKTDEAHNAVNDLLTTIGKTWGLVG